MKKLEDYTTGCLLDYDYIKHHYKLIVVDWSALKELNADPKATKLIEFIVQSKNADNETFVNASIFILTNLEKIEIRIFWRNCNNLLKGGKLSRSES